MKIILKYIVAIILVSTFIGQASSQDRRTLETKVADILVQFPTKDLGHSNKLMEEIIDLKPEGISQFCKLIIPPGTGDDTQARYALESLARYSGIPGNEAKAKTVEKTLLSAIKTSNNPEVKSFFTRRLTYCGTNNSVPLLKNLLGNKKLYEPAIAVLTTIGTTEAADAIYSELENADSNKKISFVKALGQLAYKKAEKDLLKLAEGSNGELKRQVLYALATIASPSSKDAIMQAAKEAKYSSNNSEVMIAYIEYMQQLANNGNTELSNLLSTTLLKKCKAEDQLHFRSAALFTLRANKGSNATHILIKEFKNKNKEYRNAVLLSALDGISTVEVDTWIKATSKYPGEAKAQLISSFAGRKEPQVLNNLITPSLNDESLVVKLAAIKALAITKEDKAVPTLLSLLKEAGSQEELGTIKNALLETCSKEDTDIITKGFESANNNAKVVIIEVLAARRANDYFDLVLKQCHSDNNSLSNAAYVALERISKPEHVGQLLSQLEKVSEENQIEAVQNAIVTILAVSQEEVAQKVLNAFDKTNQKEKLIPILPFLNSKEALNTVVDRIKNAETNEKEAAFTAISKWKNSDAIPHLFSFIADDKYEDFNETTFSSCLQQIMNSDFHADQKLLSIRKLMDLAKSPKQKKMVLKVAGRIKTFLSFVFVSEYLDSEEFGSTASSAAMKIMLPTPGKNDGLTGDFVKDVAVNILAKLTGSDSQYFKIDIQEYLDKLTDEKGYVSIFNGNDMEGWHGLVKNPIARSKMTVEELQEAQIAANEKMKENWSVRDGSIWFSGKGANLCTKKKYGDFEMLVDWKISKHGDSGIYLRGTPQVQIWDTSRVDVGAQVGSGGLYNNQKNERIPLVLADNAIGDWNTFYIKMIGDKVTVVLNGQLVVDNVTMENYWDRNMPIFATEAIELQAHGTDLAFRDIYVREITSSDSKLTDEEKAAGFVSLFDGNNLDYWIGNKTDYIVEGDVIAVKPKQGGHGNLYTVKEYSDFNFRFEFQLTPGANNGLGIHTPLKGDAAYVGKELQILDNTASVYANLKPYQYHGSVYGIIAAKRGFLKPVGEWNTEEVIVKGDNIKIILNGQIIVDGNMKEASENGTEDGKNHPGLESHKGHIGFLGHGSELKFKNIRIKDLTN